MGIRLRHLPRRRGDGPPATPPFARKSQAVFRDRIERAGALIVSHNMEELRRLCDAALVLEGGRARFLPLRGGGHRGPSRASRGRRSRLTARSARAPRGRQPHGPGAAETGKNPLKGPSGLRNSNPGSDRSRGHRPRARGGGDEMPELSFDEWLSSGHVAIDRGIDGLTVLETGSGAVLFSTSGPRGGCRPPTRSRPGPRRSRILPISTTCGPAMRCLRSVSCPPPAPPLIAVAAGGETGLWTYAPDANAQLGTATLLSDLGADTGPATDLAQDGTGRAYLADALTGGFSCLRLDRKRLRTVANRGGRTRLPRAQDVVRLLSVDRDGQRYVVTASRSENGVSAFADTETGLAATGSLGADDGLGVMVPTDMASAEVGDRHFIILGSSAASGEGRRAQRHGTARKRRVAARRSRDRHG